MRIITLITDFGTADNYVGAMKGVILSIAPAVRIVDITHQVPPQDVREAAYVLQSVIAYYPAGTIHVVVVDPGVGGERRPVAVRSPGAIFVGPDNGVFSSLLPGVGFPTRTVGGGRSPEPPVVVHLDRPAYWLPQVSHTFHGRDIFSPVAAHLAVGVPFEDVGTPIYDPVMIAGPKLARLADGSIRGEIVHVDHFGNLISNVPGAWLSNRRWTIALAGRWLQGVSTTYAAGAVEELVAVVGSNDTLEVAVRNGSAAQRLGVKAGELIDCIPHEI